MESFYQEMLDNIRKYPIIKKIIINFTNYIPYLTFIIYPSIIIYLYFTNNPLLLETILKPLISFLIVTIIRKIINRQRPYETMNIDPLILHKKGESFPSRHTVSAFAIALVSFNVSHFLGLFMLCLAIIISSGRILCGVHYISDVVSAIIIAFIINIL